MNAKIEQILKLGWKLEIRELVTIENLIGKVPRTFQVIARKEEKECEFVSPFIAVGYTLDQALQKLAYLIPEIDKSKEPFAEPELFQAGPDAACSCGSRLALTFEKVVVCFAHWTSGAITQTPINTEANDPAPTSEVASCVSCGKQYRLTVRW